MCAFVVGIAVVGEATHPTPPSGWGTRAGTVFDMIGGSVSLIASGRIGVFGTAMQSVWTSFARMATDVHDGNFLFFGYSALVATVMTPVWVWFVATAGWSRFPAWTKWLTVLTLVPAWVIEAVNPEWRPGPWQRTVIALLFGTVHWGLGALGSALAVVALSKWNVWPFRKGPLVTDEV